MSAHAIDVSIADFEHSVLSASHEVPVVVDFWADWCQPCRVLKPILEKLAAEYGGRFVLAKVNADENPELSARFGVRGIPAVKAFVGGAPVDEFTGALPEAKVREFIERILPSPAEPLHREALAARAAGKLDAAAELLAAAVRLDPRHEASRLDRIELAIARNDCADAQAALDALDTDGNVRDAARLDALRAQLRLHTNAGAGDIASLSRNVESAPDDLTARLQLANALALAGDYRNACGHLLEIVRRDRRWNDEAGRKTLLALFAMLAPQPEHDDLVRETRVALARTLN